MEWVSGESSQSKTAHEIEGQLWWKMMVLGQLLMQLFFTTRSTNSRWPETHGCVIHLAKLL
jgi:hypothetical protein